MDVRIQGSSQTPSASTQTLGATVLDDARRRLGRTCLIVAIANVISLAVIALNIFVLETKTPGELASVIVIDMALGSFAMGLWALGRSPDIKPALLLDVALVFQVVGALCLSIPLFFPVEPFPTGMSRIPWLCLWLVLFPLLVPVARGKAAGAAAVSFSMLPIVLGISLLAGKPLPPSDALVFTFVPVAFCAGLAMVPATIVHDLGKSVTDAKRQLDRLGSYVLVQKIGAGGMGEVWRAEHALIRRPAAIKLIRPAFLEAGSNREAILARFEREARATAALRCPHTVALYDYGVSGDGSLYYVMELLSGLDLDDLVKRHGAVPPARAVHLIRQACESLGEAHAHGLVHRDIKPANLVVCRLGGTVDFVKLLDFGLVTDDSAEADDEDSTKLTKAGSVLGTGSYMAPEMASGKGVVDGRADIYALGCVLYWLLTGGTVFEAGSLVEMLVAHMNREPLAPSARGGPHAIPDALDRIVLRCLAKDPAERPANARELEAALAGCSLDEGWTTDGARAWWDQVEPDIAETTSPAASAPTVITAGAAAGARAATEEATVITTGASDPTRLEPPPPGSSPG